MSAARILCHLKRMPMHKTAPPGRPILQNSHSAIRLLPQALQHPRFMSSRSAADEKIEEIQDLYATAKDEFDIAIEETQNRTVYAEEDRKAALEEFRNLQRAYQKIDDGPDQDVAEQVRSRIGHRIRELKNAMKHMEEMAQEQD